MNSCQQYRKSDAPKRRCVTSSLLAIIIVVPDINVHGDRHQFLLLCEGACVSEQSKSLVFYHDLVSHSVLRRWSVQR